MPRPPATFRDSLRELPMFWFFLLCWTVVHARFEYNFWVLGDAAVFAKYAAGASPEEWISVAAKVYFTKATWMFLCIWLLVLRFSLPAAMAISFTVYGLELFLLFPPTLYGSLNAGLAALMLFEVVRKRPGGHLLPPWASRDE